VRYWSVVVALLWCGCGASHPHGGADAADDASSGGTQVTVHVTTPTGDGKGDSTAIVIFSDATEVVHDGLVDANGDAAWDLPDGGSVTVLQRHDNTDNKHVDLLTTFRHVDPGDVLHAGAPKSRTMYYGQPIPMTAHMPADAYSASVFFPCGSSSQISGPPNGLETMTFYESCSPATFDMLALRDGSAGRDYVWQPNATLVTGGDVTINDTFAPMGQYTVALTNIPAEENVSVVSETMVNTFPIQLDNHSFDPTTDPTSATIMLAYPRGAGNGTVLWEREAQGSSVRHTRVAVETSSPSTVAWDLSELPLPQLAIAHADATSVSWSERGSASPSERVVVWTGQFGDHAAAWTIIEPADSATSSALLPLPPPYAADDPTANTPSNMTGTVWYVAYSNLPDYASAHVYGPSLVDPTQALLDVDHHAHVTVIASQ